MATFLDSFKAGSAPREVDIMFAGVGSEGLVPGQLPPETPDEAALVSQLRQMYEEAKSHRDKWAAPWKKSYEFYMGKQWDAGRPDWKASPVENHVFAKVETMLPILTDNRPIIHVLPNEEGLDEYATAMQKLVEYWWQRLNMDDVVAMGTKNALLFSKGFYYITWDSIKQEIKTCTVDPQNILVDPDATCIDDARYMIHVTRMPLAEAIERWPRLAGYLRPGLRTVEDSEDYKDDGFSNLTSPAVVAGFELSDSGPTGNVVPYVKSNILETADESDIVQILQYWIHDLSREVIQIPDEFNEDGSPSEAAVPRFPGGRHIILAGNRIGEDEANPYLHGEFPYVEQDCHKIPGEFWGVSAVQNLISPQMELNKTMGQIIDNKNLMGSSQWIIDNNSGVVPLMLTGQPGLVIEKNPGSEVTRIEPKALPNYVIEVAHSERIAIDIISGAPEVITGRTQGGVTAGVAIEQLQESASTRLRLLVRNLENTIRRMGEQWIGLARQFYDEMKTVRVFNDMTGEYSFVTVTPEMIWKQWDLAVAAGSTLPKSREFRHRQALELHQLGLLPPEEVLKYVNFPGAEKIAAKLQQQQQMMMEIEMMKAKMGLAAGGNEGGGGAPQARVSG